MNGERRGNSLGEERPGAAAPERDVVCPSHADDRAGEVAQRPSGADVGMKFS
jgi:hypothetical protein